MSDIADTAARRKKKDRLSEIRNDPRYRASIGVNNSDMVSREHHELMVTDPQAIAAILRDLTKDSVTLTFLAEVAGGALASEVVVPALLDLLKHPSAIVREGALCGLCPHWSPEIAAAVAPLVKDPSPTIRALVQSLLDDPPEND